MRILIALLIPGAAFAGYDRDCENGSLQACFIVGGEFAQEYSKSLDPHVGDRAFSYLERACKGGFWNGCMGIATLAITRNSDAERYLQASCDFGWPEGCTHLAQ